MKKVSVIIPAYNVEKYVEKCIISLLNQTYDNYEIILVNDGSTDKTEEILNKMQINARGGQIIVINQENEGVSSARNKGLEVADGDYIMFVDSDDWCEPNMIKEMVTNIKNSELCYCSFYLNSENSQRQKHNSFEDGVYSINKLYGSVFFGTENSADKVMGTTLWRGLFRADIIRNNNIKFDTYIRYAEDWIFYAEYFKYVNTVSLIDKPLYHYFLRSTSLTHAHRKPSELGIVKSEYILDKFRSFVKATDIDYRHYEILMAKRYINLVYGASKSYCYKDIKASRKEVYEFLEWTIEKVDIRAKLYNFNLSGLDILNRLMLFAIKRKLYLVMVLYGKAYNMAYEFKIILRRWLA